MGTFRRLSGCWEAAPTAVIVLSMGAVYLTNIYLGPIDQAEANYSVFDNR